MTRALAVLFAAYLLSACTTTKQMDHWQAEDFSRNDLNNVLIVAVTSNSTNRFLFESELERRAKARGLQTTTSLSALGDTFPQKEAVEAYIKDHKIDYVVATQLANVEVDKDYVPERVRTYYTGPYYPSYGHYYNYYDDHNTITMVREAYVDTRTTVILVTTIFDAKTEEPVWVGRSSTFEPGSVAYLAGDIARSTWRNISK